MGRGAEYPVEQYEKSKHSRFVDARGIKGLDFFMLPKPPGGRRMKSSSSLTTSSSSTILTLEGSCCVVMDDAASGALEKVGLPILKGAKEGSSTSSLRGGFLSDMTDEHRRAGGSKGSSSGSMARGVSGIASTIVLLIGSIIDLFYSDERAREICEMRRPVFDEKVMSFTLSICMCEVS